MCCSSSSADDESWLQFRDVFEVDRKPVRDRDQRLYKLFVDAKTGRARAGRDHPGRRARATTSARCMRTINIPIMALLFFERNNQPALKFERGKAGNVKRFAELADARRRSG